MTLKSIKANQTYTDKMNVSYKVTEVRRPNDHSRGYVEFYRGDAERPCIIFFDEFFGMVKSGFLTLKKEPKKAAVSAALLATVTAVAAANPAGFTYNIITGEIPASGYCVALAETQNSHGPEGLARVLSLIQSGTTRATCVGGWLDTETGRYYYDATVVVHDRAAAEALGRANKQLAIFCLDTCEEIRL